MSDLINLYRQRHGLSRSGRKIDPRKLAAQQKYGLSDTRMQNRTPRALLDQLDRCQDECARRLILGVSEKGKQ